MLGREGGHSHHRIVHALGDATGHEVMRAMIERARTKLDAQIWQNTFTIDLLTHEGRCRGALVWNAAARQDVRLGQADDPLHRRRGADLSRDDQPRRRHRRRPRASPIAPAPSCATWSSCSSIPRCSTSPAAAAA